MTGLQRVARGIDCIEQRLFLVEIGAVDRRADPDDPARVPTAPANLKLHDPHLNDLSGRRGAHGEGSACPLGCDPWTAAARSEEHTSELQSLRQLVCRL